MKRLLPIKPIELPASDRGMTPINMMVGERKKYRISGQRN